MSKPTPDPIPAFPHRAPPPEAPRWNALLSLAENLAASASRITARAAVAPAPPTPLPAPRMPTEVRAAGAAALLGALTGASRAAGRHYPALSEGEISQGEYATRIGASMLVEGAVSAGRSASTLALKHGVHHAATRLGAAGLKHFVGGAGGTLAAFAVVEQSIDTVQIARGRIDRQEYAARTLENVGAFGAGYGGAVAGAALGSAVPVLGTAVGAVVGGLVGSLGGARLARVAVRAASRHEARMASPRRGVPGVNADAAPAEAPTEAPTE